MRMKEENNKHVKECNAQSFDVTLIRHFQFTYFKEIIHMKILYGAYVITLTNHTVNVFSFETSLSSPVE